MTDAPPRLPRAVYALGLTVFCLGTSEFMIAGLLPQMSDDLGVSVPAVGHLISAFAVGMLIGAPVMALATLRLPRRTTLLGAGAVFAAAHMVGALTSSYAILFASRVVSAVACATFWAVAAVTVVAIAPRGTTARGLGVLVGGLTVANIIGVPGGTWVGERFTWQTTFVVVAVATVIAVAVVAATVPETRTVTTERIGALARHEIGALRNRRLWVALATTMSFQAAVFGTFSYLAVILIDVSGLESRWVPWVLFLFGLGSLAGIIVGSRYADRDALVNVIASLSTLGIALIALYVTAPLGPVVVVTVFAFGFAAFSIASALNARVFQHAGDAPTLASAVNVSAFNVGNAVGPWFGGLVIAAGWGYLSPVWVSLALVGLALFWAGVSWRLERRSRTVVPEPRDPCPA